MTPMELYRVEKGLNSARVAARIAEAKAELDRVAPWSESLRTKSQSDADYYAKHRERIRQNQKARRAAQRLAKQIA